MVYRVYVEKKQGLASEAAAVLADIKTSLRIASLEGLRLINRYDVENIDPELFDYCVKTVFSEPQVDDVRYSLEEYAGATVFAVEYLPGQFDQRADSAAQCIQIISQGARPVVRAAKVYALYGNLTGEELAAIKKHLINPVDSREASLEPCDTLSMDFAEPEDIRIIENFRTLDDGQLEAQHKEFGFAMDLDDLRFCQRYFIDEGREPTVSELRVIDTYWSDHCRHTTFDTTIDSVKFEDGLLQAAYGEYLAMREALNITKPVTLMDIATITAKAFKRQGRLDKLDDSDEINACTVKVTVDADGEEQDWLLFFKNETHNHPTEIEPFGGAATCIGGAIRDPLAGRGYVYAAMRLSGAANPLKSLSETLPGKLPQRKIVTSAAAGYSSYGNQIGLATGIVDEIYHDGFAAKHMELGAVLGAAPRKNVWREKPQPGDIVILLGGRTGRDGIGGATGSSKSHTVASLESCGVEVQKGNPPEERKLQRLFRNPEATRMIKRCNDFGAGGVSVAIGELADGIRVNLDAVPKKYEGLDGTELAISESQERMAVVVSPEDADAFIALARQENLEATVVAKITEEPRLVMYWRGRKIVDIARGFLNSNGTEKHIDVTPEAPKPFEKEIPEDFVKGCEALAEDLNVCSRQGLSERFDSTIGAATVLMPFGGKHQATPIQAMVHKLPLLHGNTRTCSFMAWGYNPYIMERSPYHGAYLAVVESVSKLVATGAEFKEGEVFLSFQEYFGRPMTDGKRWGKPFAALLGAFKAQNALGVAAIGGKDSMSGSFESLDVPPTLVSFAVTTGKTGQVCSPEFKAAGHKAIWLRPAYAQGLPDAQSQKEIFHTVSRLMQSGRVYAAYTPGFGGAAEAVFKMCMGNGLGFAFDERVALSELFGYSYGSFILEVDEDVDEGIMLGRVTEELALSYGAAKAPLAPLVAKYENKLEPVYPRSVKQAQEVKVPAFTYTGPAVRRKAAAPVAKPLALIPVFPGTNCEYDTQRALQAAGARTEVIVINNLTPGAIRESAEYFAKRVQNAQIIFIPGGFSGGDEPEGSGKFITAFMRNPVVRESVNTFIRHRDGLMCGICNGFQALIKLGLVPFGEILDADEHFPTLTFNTIGRHQSGIVRTRVCSNKSPWLMNANVGEVYAVPISHGEGRFIASEELIMALAKNGQIATQYVDFENNPSMDVRFNPNGSDFAIEGITSPDGRVFGKMGHCERIGEALYKNVPGHYDIGMFGSAVAYFG